ncbi:MAG: hypothetical protein NZ847_06515, partial [Acidobacteria bacterium]|nr:hypothetical protein [Acidobacteriota bacterium]
MKISPRAPTRGKRDTSTSHRSGWVLEHKAHQSLAMELTRVHVQKRQLVYLPGVVVVLLNKVKTRKPFRIA